VMTPHLQPLVLRWSTNRTTSKMADHQPHTCSYCDKFLIDTATHPTRAHQVGPDATAGEVRDAARNGCELFQALESEPVDLSKTFIVSASSCRSWNMDGDITIT